MKLISKSTELSKEFKRLMRSYNQFYWIVAWADYDFEMSKLLVANKSKIKQLVVGLHFYATHPSFLQTFYSHPGVRFLLQNQGTYHPKLYLFKNNDKDWEIMIGSGNYTKSAFINNTEVSVLISSNDKSINETYSDAMKFIQEQWKNAKVINEEYISKYKKNKSKVIQSIPNYPITGISKPLFEKDWKEYLVELNQDIYLDKRIHLLDWARMKFNESSSFDKIELKTRKSIAGFGPGEKGIEIGCFGTTRAVGRFMKIVIEKPKIISNALSKIPKYGRVTKEHYYNFIKIFEVISPNNELACATRLLCLCRPDYFVNFNRENRDAICRTLKIKTSNLNYETYWDLVIQPIIDSEWCSKRNISSKKERIIYDYRVALLDSIFVKWRHSGKQL